MVDAQIERTVEDHARFHTDMARIQRRQRRLAPLAELPAAILNAPWKLVDPDRRAVDVILPEPIDCPGCGVSHCLLTVRTGDGGWLVTCRDCQASS